MKTLLSLFDLLGAERHPEEEQGRARQLQLAITAVAVSTGFAAVFGLAAGSTELSLALTNLVKVPMVVVLSGLCALPVGLLSWKLLGASCQPTDLVMSVVTGNFTATLVLAALSPLIALYYHSSAFMGAPLAMAVVSLAVGLGVYNAVRGALVRRPEGVAKRSLALPLGILVATQLLALLQFIHIASPILPEVTVFDQGVDGWVR